MRSKFIEFLKAHNAYARYLYNLERHSGGLTLEWIIENIHYDRWIQSAFVWNSTPQKLNFWYKLNEEWLKAIR